jgi:GNAT superfamily N-acetyltransferase
MTRAELDMSLGWAAAEGWNPGIHDADCFYATGASGFLMGFDKGEPYGSISAVKYGHYAFMGLYMVNPAHRQEGIGTQLGEAALARVEGLDLGLDGVMEQVETYQSLGFEVAYNNSRYRGTASGGTQETDPRIVELSTVSFDDLRAYDESVFMAPRPEFLACWVKMPDSVALAIQENGQLAGYTVLRKCQEGYKYGPLFADSPELAEVLFNAAGARIPAGTPVFLDVPGANAAAVELATRHNMDSVFSTARMYRMAKPGTQMNLPLHRWFGVTTLELG